MTDSTANIPNSFMGEGRIPPSLSPSDASDIDIRSLFLMLWRRRMIVVGCVLIGLSIVTIVMSFIQPQYIARSLFLIETEAQSQNLEDLKLDLGSFRMDTSVILSEIEIMKSRLLAKEVVKRLNLLSDPEFNAQFKYTLKSQQSSKPANVKLNTQEVPQDFKKLSVYGEELQNLPPELVEKQIEEVITNFLFRLSIRSIPGSNAIQIEFTSNDPNKAALVANTIADVYIEQRLGKKFEAVKKVTDWLDHRLSALRKQVQEADAAVAKYKETHNITQGSRSSTISEEQLSALNSQLVVAQARKAEVLAKLAHVKEMVKDPAKIEATSEVLNSELLQKLKHDKSLLEGQLAEMQGRYGPKHPALVKAKAELAELSQTIRTEVLKTAEILENEVMYSDASIKALENGLAEYQNQQFSDNEMGIGLGELERQAESTRLIYDTFLKSYKRNDDREQLQSPEARVISFAIAPRSPSYPNKMLMLSLGGIISLFVGLAIALLIEKMDNTFRSANQIERMVGYPCYAMIPLLENMTQPEMIEYIVSKPSSTVAESVRTLRLVLNLRAQSGKKPRCITLTSSFPNEGKTTLSIWLARLAAKSGEKVIIIDADLRRPNVHRAMGKNNDVSLVDYLTGQKSLEEVIQKDEASGLHMIYARSVPNSALDLVSSEKMARLVASLKQVYDLVIIDSAACVAVSDARVLANMSDQLLYVVAWDKTPREVVLSGVKQFADMGYDNVAFVLGSVDVKRHARYGYGDTANYYGRYKEYYTN